MDRAKIKKIALENGFEIKEQPSGEMDLNPYVYDFVDAIIAGHNQSGWYELEKSEESSKVRQFVDGHWYVENDDGRNDRHPACIAEEWRRQMEKD